MTASLHKVDNVSERRGMNKPPRNALCLKRGVDIVRTKIEAPRLLSSVAPYVADKPNVVDKDVSGARLSRSGIFCGSSRWWFLGMLIGGAVVIGSAHTFHERYL